MKFALDIAYRLLILFAFVCVAANCGSTTLAQYANPAAPPDSLVAGYNSITEQQAKDWLGVLAGPGFEGRGTGQPGYTKAAHWVAGKLAEFGLEPIGDNGTYFQMLPMERRLPQVDQCFITGSDSKSLVKNSDWNDTPTPRKRLAK